MRWGGRIVSLHPENLSRPTSCPYEFLPTPRTSVIPVVNKTVFRNTQHAILYPLTISNRSVTRQ